MSYPIKTSKIGNGRYPLVEQLTDFPVHCVLEFDRKYKTVCEREERCRTTNNRRTEPVLEAFNEQDINRPGLFVEKVGKVGLALAVIPLSCSLLL